MKTNQLPISLEQEEIERFRKDTPGCLQRIHLNNAGASLPTQVVTDAMVSYLQKEALIGGYELKAQMAEDIQGFYELTAQLLHTQAHNIAYTSSATDSYARALSSIPFEEGDIILTTDDDYVSNQLAFLSLQKRYGVDVRHCPISAEGGMDIQRMMEMIRQLRPKVVAITHVPTNSGLVQDVAPIGAICQEVGSLYLVDACQSLGQMDVNVEQIQCDFLSATGRKFLRGPRGTGLLYISDRALDKGLTPLFLDLRGADWKEKDQFTVMNSARRYEYWEFPYALLLGLKEAVNYASKIGLDRIEQRVRYLANYTRQKLGELDFVRSQDRGARLCGIVTFTLDGHSKEDMQQIQRELIKEGVNLSSGRSSALIDFDRKQIDWIMRLSPHYYNTEEEIDRCIEMLAHFAK
ncbi:MAG: aminotransferase class V-fold PLP-dependent enzyme [Bacteroidota bacterium]